MWDFQQSIQWPKFEKCWFKPVVPQTLPGYWVPHSLLKCWLKSAGSCSVPAPELKNQNAAGHKPALLISMLKTFLVVGRWAKQPRHVVKKHLGEHALGIWCFIMRETEGTQLFPSFPLPYEAGLCIFSLWTPAVAAWACRAQPSEAGKSLSP